MTQARRMFVPSGNDVLINDMELSDFLGLQLSGRFVDRTNRLGCKMYFQRRLRDSIYGGVSRVY